MKFYRLNLIIINKETISLKRVSESKKFGKLPYRDRPAAQAPTHCPLIGQDNYRGRLAQEAPGQCYLLIHHTPLSQKLIQSLLSIEYLVRRNCAFHVRDPVANTLRTFARNMQMSENLKKIPFWEGKNYFGCIGRFFI